MTRSTRTNRKKRMDITKFVAQLTTLIATLTTLLKAIEELGKLLHWW